jgi:hypothetical protein
MQDSSAQVDPLFPESAAIFGIALLCFTFACFAESVPEAAELNVPPG